MGIQNKEGALYFATGFDNSGLYSGRQEAMGIIKAMASEITSFDVFGGLGISAGIAFAKAAKGAYDFEKQFQQSMKEVATLSSGIKGSLTDYMNQVMDLTREVPVLANDAAKALYQIVSAGHDGADGMKVLEVSAKAAVGGVTDTATAADGITTLLNAYKLDVSQAEKISDQLFTTVKLGKTSFGELGKSIAQVAPIAAAYGVETDQVLAAVATLTKQGTPTAQAMTQIRASIIAVSKVLGDGAFDGRTYQEALVEVAKQAGGSESKLRELVPEVEAVNAVLGMTGINVKEAAGHLEEMQNATGAAEEAFKEMASSAENQMKLLSNNITAFLRPMGEAVLKEVSSIASAFNKAFDNGDVQASLKNIGDLIVIVTTALVGYKGAIVATNVIKKVHTSLLEMERYEMTLYRKAVEAGTISENALTSAQVKQMATRKAMITTVKMHTAALKRNIAALATNPYILAAAATAALGYAIYKVVTYQSDMEKMQSRLNKAMREAEKSSLSEQRELVKLKGELSGLTKGTEEYNIVKDKIVKGFGKYYKGLDDEINKVGLTETAYNKLTEAINKSFSARQYEKFSSEQQEALADIMSTNLEKIQKRLIGRLGDETGSKIYAKIRDAVIQGTLSFGEKGFLDIQGLDSETKAALDQISGKARGDLLRNSSLDGYIRDIILASQKTDELDKKARERFGIDDNKRKTDDSGDGSDKSDIEKEEKKDKAYWKKQKEEATKALESIASAQKKQMDAGNFKGIDSSVVALYKENAKKLKEAEKELMVYDGYSKQDDKAKKLREEQERYAILLDKQKLERQRLNEDLETQVAQATIDAMSDGFDKIQAQRELDNKREINALERQKEDYIRTIIQAEKDKFDAQEELKENQINGYKRKTFDASSVSVDVSKFDKIIENVKTSRGLNEWEQREASMNEYLLKYGTFTQKKDAIDKKYRDAIEKEADLGKKNSLQKEWDEQLANLDLSKLKDEINWEIIFGDLSKVTKDQLTKIKNQLQEFKKSPEFQNATPEQIQVIEGAINSINNAMVDKGGFFGGMTDSVKELKIATEELKKAEEELAEANRMGTEAEKEEAQKKVNQAKNRQQNAQTNVEKSSDKAIQHLTAVGDAIAQLGSSAEMSLSSFGNAAANIVDAFSEAGSKIGGIIGAIFSILEGIQKQGLDGFVGNIIGNVAGAVGGILDTLTFGAFGLKGADYSGYNEMVAKYDSLLNVWDQLLDKKKAYIKESYGPEATKVGQEALDLLNSEREIAKELASSRLDAGKSAGSHSMNYRMWKGSYDYNGQKWKDVAPEISNALGGVDFSSMWSMLNMSSEQLEWIKTNYSGLWAHMDSDFKGYLENIIQYGDTEKEIIESINEQLTQTSFDSLFDSFLNTLMDMDASSKDFADNFEEYMRKAIFTSMFAKNYEDELSEWYKAFANANDKIGGMTTSDVQDLRNRWDDIVNGALSDREAWEKIVGSSSESTSQSSSQKGFAAMSQDTGEELNGRFTALQIAGEATKEQIIVQTGIQQIMSQRLEAIYNFNYSSMTEMRDIIFDVMDILTDMKKDTSHLYFIRESLNKIESNTKGLTSK